MAKSESNLSPKQASDLKKLATKYNTKTSEVDALRAQLDDQVLAARDSGGTFREIASLAARSVAWVQGSLERSNRRTK